MDLSGRRKWTEATETVAIPGDDTFKRITLAISDVVTGNIRGVRHYLDHSNDADIFIHGVEAAVIIRPVKIPNLAKIDDSDDAVDSDSEQGEDIWISGKTALQYAACEASLEMVQLLLEKGADPDAQDLEGRTPLVEAALWGRLRSVEALLSYGANKDLECVRDGLPVRAIDFAKPLRVNQNERHRHNPHGTEKTYERDQDREAIVCLLQDEVEEQSRNRSGFTFMKLSGAENPLTLVAHFDVPNKWKTIGVLYRGSQLPLVGAMSGWGYQDLHKVNIQISGKKWTNDVKRLCRIVGHYLPPHLDDQGEPGRYYACHAEKQLIAYFVHKHLFLGDELKKDIDLAKLNLDEAFDNLDLKEEGEHRKKLSDLQTAKPPTSLRKATIIVCREVCADCRRFVVRTNKALGLEISLASSIAA